MRENHGPPRSDRRTHKPDLAPGEPGPRRVSFDLTAGEADALDKLVDSGLFGTSRIAAARRLFDAALVEAALANGIRLRA